MAYVYGTLVTFGLKGEVFYWELVTLIGGSVNGTGSLTVEVLKTGEDSYLSRVVKLVRDAGQSKSHAQGLADRAAFWLTIVAVSVGGLYGR